MGLEGKLYIGCLIPCILLFRMLRHPIRGFLTRKSASGGYKMAEYKLVLSNPKTGKSVQRELKDEAAKGLKGRKIGEAFKGEAIDLPGYEFVITGGSDSSGFPMRWDVEGSGRKQVTMVKGVGVKNKKHRPNPKKKGWRTMKGMRLKKTVAGNTIHEKTAQVNLKVMKVGREDLFAEAKPEADAPKEGAAEEGKAEEKPAAKPKEEAKPKESKQEEKGGEKKVEEQKAKEPETVADNAEEVIEKVEEVPVSGGEQLEETEEKTEEKEAPAAAPEREACRREAC
jgi:small subunit ribosomal protein S6e